jgi:hypothetical protein
MSDESKQFQVNIVTTASGAGAKETAADLDAVKTKAAEAAPAVAALAAAEKELGMIGAMGSGVGDSAERQNSLLQQRRAIITQTTELIRLEAEGLTEEAAALSATLALMKEAYALQTRGLLSEQLAVTIAEERAADQEKINTAKQLEIETNKAQEALNVELIAEEKEKLFILKEQAAAQARIKAEQEAEAASAAATMASKDTRILRGVGREAGLGRNTGLLGALGPEAIAAGVAIEGLIGLFKHMNEVAVEAAKAVAEANKEAAKSTKEMVEAAKKGLKEATAEAEAYVVALKGINEAREKGDQRLAAEHSRQTRRKLLDSEEEERKALLQPNPDDAGEADITPEQRRLEIHAKYEKLRAQIKSDAEVRAAVDKTGAEEAAGKEAAEMQKKVEEKIPAAQDDAQKKRERATASERHAKEAEIARQAVENDKSWHIGDGTGTPQERLEKAKAQEASQKATAEKDRQEATDADSKVSGLRKSAQDLQKTAEESANRVKGLTEEQKLVADESAERLVKQNAEIDNGTREAHAREIDKEREKTEREKAAAAEARKGDSHEDKADEPAKPKVDTTRRGEEHPRGGSHRDSHASPHHRGPHGPADPDTDFESEFHRSVAGAKASKDFDLAFGPNQNRPPLVPDQSADRKGAQEERGRDVEGVIADAKQTISEGANKQHEESTQRLIETIKEATSHLKDLKGANKDDAKWKEIQRAMEGLRDEVKALKDQFKANR